MASFAQMILYYLELTGLMRILNLILTDLNTIDHIQHRVRTLLNFFIREALNT